MENNQFTVLRLNEFFDKFITDFNEGGIWHAYQLYNEDLNDVLGQLLSETKWSLETFVGINYAFSLFSEIILDCRKTAIEHKRKTSLANVTVNDIKHVISQISKLCSYHLDNNENKFGDYVGLEPIVCLSFAKQKEINVSDELAQHIKFSHWGLNFKSGVDGKDHGLTFTIHEVAKYFTDVLSTPVSERNVLELCLMSHKYGFGAYLYADRFPIKGNNTPTSVAEVYNLDKKMLFINEYPYHYRGLIRLIKKYSPDVCGFITQQTLEYLYHAGEIILSHENDTIMLQPSLSQLVLGTTKNINYCAEHGVKITVEDLVFVRYEVTNFVSNNMDHIMDVFSTDRPISKNAPAVEDQLLSRPAIKDTYTKIPARSWEEYLNQKNQKSVPLQIKGKNAKGDRFSRKDIHNWLIENNYYTAEELKKF